MKEKNTQPEAINVEEVVGKSEAFINKYKKQILAAIAAIVVIVAGTILYQDYVVEPKAKAASAAIFQAQKYFAAQEFDKALNGDEQGNMGLIQVIDEFGGTPTANVANAYAGLALAQTGRYEEAIPYLKAFDGDDNMVAPGVLSALGNCYANTGDLSAAASKFIEAAKAADNNTISPTCLLQAGQIYTSLGQNEKALDCYNQIKSKYQQSNAYYEIDKYIEACK